MRNRPDTEEFADMLDLSVIIVNWNTRELLRTCLTSVYQYTEDVTYEVCVVDNGSHDGSPAMIAQEFPAVHLIQNRENLGFSKATNQGIRHSSGRYVLLLNSDTELSDNVFHQMIVFMDEHPFVGVAGPKLLNPDGSRQYSCDCFPRPPFRLLWEKVIDLCAPENSMTRRGKMAQWDYTTNFAVDYLIGAVFLIRRHTLENIGLLDEQFFMYAEDIDWCYRAALTGWQIYYLGAISVFHHNRGSSEATVELSQRLRALRTKSLLQFYRKHYGKLAATLLHCYIAKLFSNSAIQQSNNAHSDRD